MDARHPYKKLSWYAHLSEEEARIWDRFIEKHPDRFSECEYDVKVGVVPTFVKDDPDPAQQGQAPLYRRKIDVVAYKDSEISLIELKRNAGMSVVGQIKGYKQLFVRDLSPNSNPHMIVVTDRADEDARAVMENEGIECVVV